MSIEWVSMNSNSTNPNVWLRQELLSYEWLNKLEAKNGESYEWSHLYI